MLFCQQLIALFLDYQKNNEVTADNTIKMYNLKTAESESPGYIPCTQEGFENIDVVWDWNSPQSKRVQKKRQKRLSLSQSPKTTLKRHLSNNSVQGFEKLQEELRLLKEEIAVPEHEESLVLSPIEEAEYKNHLNDSNSIHNIELENYINEAEDFFNDSLDEQLLTCTTQIENKLNEFSSKNCDNSNYKSNNNQQIKPVSNITSNIQQHSKMNSNTVSFIDNFEFEDSFANHENTVISKLHKNKTENAIDSVGKVEFHRTQSFEMSNIGNPIGK